MWDLSFENVQFFDPMAYTVSHWVLNARHCARRKDEFTENIVIVLSGISRGL